MEPASSPLRYRKNGRLQACDPCRRRKVACDHARPVCSNCKRRRRAEPCEYTICTPSRMRPRAASAQMSRSVSVTASEVATEQYEHATASTLVNQSQERSPFGQEKETLDLRVPVHEIRGQDTLSGHLGFTSWSDVYKEVGNGLSGHDLHAQRDAETNGQGSRIRKDTTNFAEDAKTLETCLSILREVPREHEGRALFDPYSDPHNAFIHPVMERALDSLYGTFDHYLGAVRDDSQLSEFARVLCCNSARPFSEHETNSEMWMAQFMGNNLRWETLGILFVYWELKARNTQFARTGVGRMGYGQKSKFRNCILDCMSLARQATKVGNSLLLYLSFRKSIIESIIDGETTLSTWLSNGETVSLLTFLGLHVEQNKQPYKPTLASELRRRLLLKIFCLDKVGAAITGRPPALSRRYVLTPLPLDIRDEVLMADDETIAKAVRSLDAHGRNPDGALYSVTMWRARYSFMQIRDEIFEIALGSESVISDEAVRALKVKELKAAAEVPTIMQFDESDIRDSKISGQVLHVKLLMLLEHLQNLFFIERLLNRLDCSNRRELLAVSYEMTSTTLLFWTNMDGLGMLCEDFKWLVMSYAAPGGGILCLELLQPAVTINGTGVAATDSKGNAITRSSIVQVLSLLVGFLKWVSPQEVNGGICVGCRSIVQRVLDEALNMGPRGNPTVDGTDWDFSAQLDFNFDLLDTFEWMRPEFPWSDVPSQG
ncbi:fungal specific transcription factor [Colletotrichum incanum]|uniref:Fungal specific transcription factor n=1 Tax=Colletotrichum incanum TaxID=1573173 RepID=A0A162NM84_COLIC|nr:fungal specific transcription factor [Colletotrichum incanum]OHW99932.1 fungal specific transcription factor [Colletotrichum incanum]